MGSSLNSDKSCKVFLTTSKRVHYAGQMVEGAVHIVCEQDRPYVFLNLRIMGKEHVIWTQDEQKHSYTYTNERQTYIHEFGLAKFNSVIYRGHYSYPFSFLLPASMPASANFWAGNYINYTIEAVIHGSDASISDQIFKKTLHVRQPPRGIQQLKGQNTSESSCCGCCCSCGTCTLYLQSNQTSLAYDRIFHVRGSIDTAMSQTPVKNFKAAIRERITLVANCGRVRQYNNDFLIYDALKAIPSGAKESFSAEVKVPPEVSGYTAIGNIISRSYYLTLIAEVNCCYSNPNIQMHAVLNNQAEPHLQEEENILPPEDWNPVVAQPVIMTNLQPYKYYPQAAIPAYNQLGQAINMGIMNTEMDPVSLDLVK